MTKARVLAVICALVALAARAAYWAWATPDRELTSDSAQYHFLANNLADGKGYVDTFPQLDLHPTAFRPPLYPALLSIVYRVFGGSEWVGRATNVVIGVAVIVLVVLLVERHLGPTAGFLAGLAAALSPNLIANDTYVLTEPLSLLIMVLLMGNFLAERWIVVGALSGLLLLTRPSAQLLVLVVALWILWKIGWRSALAYASVVLLVTAPWLIRNWSSLGSPVFVTSNGFNLAAMYSPPAHAARAFIDPMKNPFFDDRRWDQFDEALWDRNLRNIALDGIKRHPTIVPLVVVRNAVAHFELRPDFNENAELADGRNMAVRLVTLPYFYLLLIGGGIGWFRLRSQRIALVALSIGATFTLSSLLFVAPPRLRSPVDLLLCVGVAGLAARVLARPRDETDDVEPSSADETFADARDGAGRSPVR